MSSSKRIQVSCPKCRKSYIVTTWSSINTKLNGNVSKDVISAKIFKAVCPHCNHESSLAYDVLYHDINRQAMIWVLYPNSKNYKNNIIAAKNNSLIDYSYTRLVSSIDELREKVSALESGRDDRLIELYKYYVKYTAANDFPDLNFINAQYLYDGGQERIYLYSDDGGYKVTNIQDELYNFIRSLFEVHLNNESTEKFPMYNQGWAVKMYETINLSDSTEENHTDNKSRVKIQVTKKTVNHTEKKFRKDLSTQQIKFCRKCGKELLEDSVFCSYCGTKITK